MPDGTNAARQRSSSAKRNKFANSGAATEIFHIVQPKVREKRWELAEGEIADNLSEEHKRSEKEAEIQRHAKITLHKHERSSSRASDSSRKARREMHRVEAEMSEIL